MMGIHSRQMANAINPEPNPQDFEEVHVLDFLKLE
jgi:hypothetical protein